MNIEAFREALLQDGFTVVERAVAPNSSLEEHDHDWEVKAMIMAGSFYVHTKTEQKTYREGEVFTLTANEAHIEGAGEYGASLLIGRK
ncbi:MAG: cupin [Rhodobacteraceae bacterium]|nr:cupin [Paracoccaceae bacterium]